MSKQVRHKRGDIRPDGRVYWGCPRWISIEQFEKRKAYEQTPERKAYQKAYQQTPERKAYQKARRQTPERKASARASAQTPEYKAYQKSYGKARRQTPEYKAYKKALQQTLRKEQSTADAFRMMQAASELSKALINLPNTKTQ